MAAPEQGSSGVPQFLTKLWLLVGDNATDSLIRWGEEGNTFIVLDQPQFAREVLPLYFKHNNMASFVRQLNMYGFRKKANIEQGALKSVREDVEFIHPHFRRGQPGQLELIKRKVSGKDDPKVKTEEVNRILSDIKGMKAKQQDINGTLESMKRENQALWSEVMMLRQRHDKQQKIVNRLIQFLLTLVNPVGLKRKQQLAIEAGGSSTSGPSRPPKYSKQISLHGNLEDLIGLQTGSPLSNLDAAGGATGAILSDITDKSDMSTGGVTVSEVTSPLDPNPKSFIETSQSCPQQTQAAFAGTSTSANLSTPTVTTSSETPFLQTIGDMSSMPISELLTPMTRTLVPELGDIATMPISEILAPSSQSEASTSTSVAEPIVTSPMSAEVTSSLEQSQTSVVDGDGVLSVLDTPNVMPSMELIPKESDEMMGDPSHPKILKRALSTEEIEQKEQLGCDLNALQANIDSIQHLLTSTNPTFTVDPDVLLGSLFDLTDPVGDFNPANISGTEMIEYNPDGSSSLPVGVDVSDEDSLLESLNEDSRALARNIKTVEQEEID